eukprot:897206_1
MNARESKRFKTAADFVFSDYKSVLDVGCRDKALKPFLKMDATYQGIDYKNGEDVIGHNLEKGIPFPDNTYDVVFALDVLEHVDNVHFLFQEIIRVSKHEVVVALPNIYYWKARFRFLKGVDISDKYTFYINPQKDRHRWITSYNSYLKFVKQNSNNQEVSIKKK